MRARRIGQAASDYVLRRTKDKVLTDLPPKLYREAELDLTSPQWDAYRTAEEQGVVQLSGHGRVAHDPARLRAGLATQANL